MTELSRINEGSLTLAGKRDQIDAYIQKASSHSRVKSCEFLPIDTTYFLEAYESCLQITEWLEQSLHENWHSSQLIEDMERLAQNVQQENAADTNGAGCI